MIHEINKLLNDKAKVTNQLKEYVKDKNIPLDQRWDLFIYSELGDHSTTYEEPDGMKEGYSLYDDFYLDKYRSITADSMLKLGLENNTIKDKIAFKEWWLTNFIKSFDNDW